MTRHVSRAAEKLRDQGGQANSILVFIQTNTFIEGEPQYCQATSLALVPPTSHTAKIVRSCGEALKRIFRAGFRYKKVRGDALRYRVRGDGAGVAAARTG